MVRRAIALIAICIASVPLFSQALPERTLKPTLHAKHWVAITGKPLAATAGAMTFQKGGNAVDAAAAMIAAACTMWDTLSWGGETQALIYNPKTGQVIGLNALGTAPTGATAAFFKEKNMKYPPEHGPLAAVVPGTVGGIITMVAEYGKLSLKDILEPSIQMADGYAIETSLVRRITAEKEKIKEWPYSKAVMYPREGSNPPKPGQVFKQADLAATLRKLVETERQALEAGRSRKEAMYAAYDRFYRGDIAKELVRGAREQGALLTEQDLAGWKVKLEPPVKTTYKDVEVYKLTTWTQGPALLQALNILENFDLKSMGYNSARYIHTVYQAMNLAFADRDFYYGDPDFPPAEPVRGLLSKEYAKERARTIGTEKNDAAAAPGDPYPFQGDVNPFMDLLKNWSKTAALPEKRAAMDFFESPFYAGTTSVQAADEEGWVVSVTPSGGWVPAVIAGKTGVGLSQRAQSFHTDPAESPFNIVEPGKRPRVTLTPSLALKNGKPFLSFAVQGGDSQDQNLLQLFLNVVEFGMGVQEATEAANFNSFQMRSSFGKHETQPGKIQLREDVPSWVRKDLRAMGYDMEFRPRTSGPINAIWFDQENGTLWGGSSNFEEDYGIGW
jgi:gamma-glutamyltranspeptidase/glutathione hydrolase